MAASAVACWKSCNSTMPLPCFFNFSITDCLTCSGLRILKSNESMSAEKMPMLRLPRYSISSGGCRSVGTWDARRGPRTLSWMENRTLWDGVSVALNFAILPRESRDKRRQPSLLLLPWLLRLSRDSVQSHARIKAELALCLLRGEVSARLGDIVVTATRLL